MAEVKDYSADALLRKEKEVELDTDGVKEENVEVKEETKKEEKEKPNLNVGEVDLGYTDHSKEPKEEKVAVEEIVEEEKPKEEKKEEKKVESKTEEKKDNLNQYTESVQKRIDKLTRKRHEAERREKAALDYAKGLQKKYDSTLKKFNSTDEQYLKELDARVDAQREQTKIVLKDALEKNDVDKIMEANDALTKLAVEKEKARLELAHRAEIKKQEEDNQKQQQNVESKPQEGVLSDKEPNITPKARKWAEDNKWFGEDEVMTNAAITIHNNLAAEGLEVDSDEYYNEVNARLRKYFPSSFASDETEQKKEQKKPVQTVASAGRKQQGRRTVKLTKSQVAIAKRLGVPLEEYARYVKEDI